MSSEQEARRLRFLCTNDDGIHAPGLALLSEVAGRLGDVFVVAPDRQRSGSSHSLTLNSPLRATPVGENRLSLDGTPTDCVLVAVNLLCEQDPHFVLSGVNHGANMGEDVLYSGTVAAAMEGTILGIPAIAVSFVGRDDELLRGYADIWSAGRISRTRPSSTSTSPMCRRRTSRATGSRPSAAANTPTH
jgi:5'-nucleotidase